MTTPAGGIEPDTEADEATTFMGLAPEVRRRMWQVAMTPEPRDPGYIDEPGYAFFNDALKRCEGRASTATASPHLTDGESIGTTAYGYPPERSALQPEAPCEDRAFALGMDARLRAAGFAATPEPLAVDPAEDMLNAARDWAAEKYGKQVMVVPLRAPEPLTAEPVAWMVELVEDGQVTASWPTKRKPFNPEANGYRLTPLYTRAALEGGVSPQPSSSVHQNEPTGFRWRFREGKDKTWRFCERDPRGDPAVIELEPLYRGGVHQTESAGEAVQRPAGDDLANSRRYLWLRDLAPAYFVRWLADQTPDLWDAAIDAAMKERP